MNYPEENSIKADCSTILVKVDGWNMQKSEFKYHVILLCQLTDSSNKT